jgi:hypothetical protein
MNALLKISILLLGTLLPLLALAGPRCEDVFTSSVATSFAAVNELVELEVTKNVPQFQIEHKSFSLAYSLVPLDQVNVYMSPGTPNALREQFIKQVDGVDYAVIPKHPFNTSEQAAFYAAPVAGTLPQAYLTASRSIMILPENGGGLSPFSVKVGTNRPRPEVEQKKKAGTKGDILGALLREPILDQLQKSLKTFRHQPMFLMLRERIVIQDKTTRQGLVVRDYSDLKNENHYMAGLSLPYVGEKIAETNGADFNEFWAKSYAAVVGQAKAQLLLFTGMQMATPNSQNLIVEFDPQYVPTGRFVFRDLSDTKLYQPVARHTGLSGFLFESSRRGSPPVMQLAPRGSLAFWRFDESGNPIVNPDVIKTWQIVHDKAYIDEVLKLLKEVSPNIDSGPIKSVEMLDAWLKSSDGQLAIENFEVSLHGQP